MGKNWDCLQWATKQINFGKVKVSSVSSFVEERVDNSVTTPNTKLKEEETTMKSKVNERQQLDTSSTNTTTDMNTTTETTETTETEDTEGTETDDYEGEKKGERYKITNIFFSN